MGAATARRMAAEGAHVVIVDFDATRAAEVSAAIVETGGSASAEVGDVSDPAFARRVIADTVAAHGRVDVLVNAAGIIVRAAGVDTTDEQWERIMAVNVSGTFFFCRAAISAMRRNGGGAIVNFGSIWGDLGSTGVAAYCASKGAVHNLTRALALDHADENIRVNAVCPGEIRTPMLQAERNEPVTDELLARIAATVPMGRLAEPEEVANVVRFLASDEASYVTGTLVTVDAGFAAR
jgi:meso-butanediol dehydrogenase / (S,S)-butanediol dehydrogenase / diacetyl reductase